MALSACGTTVGVGQDDVDVKYEVQVVGRVGN